MTFIQKCEKYKTGKLNGIFKKDPEFIKELIERTSFLAADSHVKQRIYHVLNHNGFPKCTVCGSEVKIWLWQKNSYSLYCGKDCANKSPLKTLNYKKTCLDRYGVDSPIKNKEIKQKIRDTVLEKYGADSYVQTDKFRKEKKPHKLSEEGRASLSRLMKARSKELKEAFVEKYGVNSPMDLDHIKQKYRNSHLKKYGFADELQFEQFIKEQNKSLSATQIAEKLEIHSSSACKWFRRLSVDLRFHYTSKEEQEISAFLSENGVIHSNNVRNIIDGELDIFIPDKNIAIEYCGLFWHSEIHKDKIYHQEKYKKCLAKGIRLITIFQDEWIYKKQICKDKLLHILGFNKKQRINARECDFFVDNNTKQFKHFFESNHIQGYVNCSYSICLKKGEDVVAVGLFLKKKDSVEMVRYATNSHVIGGFSKILKAYQKQSSLPLVTFCDLRWHDGITYQKFFNKCEEIKPDYYYAKRDKRFHKFNFRHKVLSKFETYDFTKSEHENCLNAGYYRIYDCGKMRYTLI